MTDLLLTIDRVEMCLASCNQPLRVSEATALADGGVQLWFDGCVEWVHDLAARIVYSTDRRIVSVTRWGSGTLVTLGE